jgi:hypothetical protein
MTNGVAEDKAVRNWNISLVIFLIIVAAVLIILRAMPPPLTKDAAFTVNTIPWDIANEQIQYAWLFTNWTAADWILTILAAGTAIGAAVKNAFSSHNQVQAQAVKVAAAADALSKGQQPAPDAVQPSTSNGIDKWIMALAALTIIATTLDAKMHAGVQADRYRRGDLILQEALIDYKVSKDQAPLVASWHKAQRILEGLDASAEPQAKPDNDLSGQSDATRSPPITANPPDKPASNRTK